MSCTTDRCHDGFTLVELLLVIALISTVIAMSGMSLVDQLRAQQVVDAIDKARIMANAIERIRPALFDVAPSTFGDGTSTFGGTLAYSGRVTYNDDLAGFLDDVDDDATALLVALEDNVSADGSVLNRDPGTIYQVALTPNATFVSLVLDNTFADFDFMSTAKTLGAGVAWTVSSRLVTNPTIQYQYINEINKPHD
jgi:prepilin-type N-terminal cleavage/methylation domain-containing protein